VIIRTGIAQAVYQQVNIAVVKHHLGIYNLPSLLAITHPSINSI
jgi:hypothetical protein